VNVVCAVPVKKVYIASISPQGVNSPVDNDGVVTLTQLRDDGVACVAVVDGSRQAPQVEVVIGDVDATWTGTRLYDDSFRYSFETTVGKSQRLTVIK